MKKQSEKDVKEMKELADTFRGAADILDEVTANLQDGEITDEDREKKNDELMGRFVWQMMKLQQMQS